MCVPRVSVPKYFILWKGLYYRELRHFHLDFHGGALHLYRNTISRVFFHHSRLDIRDRLPLIVHAFSIFLYRPHHAFLCMLCTGCMQPSTYTHFSFFLLVVQFQVIFQYLAGGGKAPFSLFIGLTGPGSTWCCAWRQGLMHAMWCTRLLAHEHLNSLWCFDCWANRGWENSSASRKRGNFYKEYILLLFTYSYFPYSTNFIFVPVCYPVKILNKVKGEVMISKFISW